MKTNSPSLLISTLFTITVLTSCVKDLKAKFGIEDTCTKVSKLHAHAFPPITKGGEIRLSADYLKNVTYQWRGPGNYNVYDDHDTFVTGYAELKHRGWYYVAMQVGSECYPVVDSVYVDVKFPQGTPACALTNNKSVFSGSLILWDQSYSNISFGQGSSYYEIKGNSSGGDITIQMSSYWKTHPLEDGIYYTFSSAPGLFDDIDRIYITDVNQGIFWTAESMKPVYISHVGSKAVISFCGLSFSGSWGGTQYKTTVSTKITQP